MKWFYQNREERSRWLAERFSSEITESASLLDIGCYNADFKNYINEKIKYTGIDIVGKPDIFLNLDKIDKLPFNDNEFDTIVCADVLEHLENIHLIFDELCRVAKKNIIITLPNAYASLPEFLRGKKYAKTKDKRLQFGKFDKFYGLPLEKPEDRHRWFFSKDEASEFVKYRAEKYSFSIKTVETEFNHTRPTGIKWIFHKLFKKINSNLVGGHIIIVLESQ